MPSQRIVEIDAELRKVNKRRRKLLEERRHLTNGHIHASHPWMDTVFQIIKSRPGISRREIFIEMNNPDVLFSDLGNCLTTLRRRDLTENRGTRKHPRWYPKEEVPPEPLLNWQQN